MIPTGAYVTAVTSREVRDLADLGSASRWLGERWETLGQETVALLVGAELRSPSHEVYRCQAILSMHGDSAMLAECSGRGLKSPDCLFIGRDRLGRVIVQPGDFKFTLDVATRAQIDPAPIRALIEGGGPLFQRAMADLMARGGAGEAEGDTARALLQALDTGRARLLPGLFLTPDEPSNRHYLRAGAGRRRANLTLDDVHFLPVSAERFFEGLPGSEASSLLRQVDGVAATRAGFCAATYYYQLGSAVRGAFLLLRRPLLDLLGPAPDVDIARELRAHLARHSRGWAIDVARDLAQPAIARRDRLRLAHRLAGSSMRGRPAYEVAAEAGWRVANEPGEGVLTKATFKSLLDQVEIARRQALAELLAERLARSLFNDDQEILNWLRDTRPALEARDREELTRLLGAIPRPEPTSL